MGIYRRNRINDALTRELSEILRTVKDPRVSDAFISVTRADCTADLKQAKIYYSVMHEEDVPEVKKGLKSAEGYIRRELAQRLNLRVTPELIFLYDASLVYGAHISSLMHKVEEELAAHPQKAPEEADRNDAE